MKRKLSFLLLYATLVLFGGLGALLLIFGEKLPHPSQTENRMLAGFPALSVDAVKDGSFMAGLEDYLSDNMPERDQLVLTADLLTSRFSLDPATDEEAAQAALYEQVMAFGQMPEEATAQDVPQGTDQTPADLSETPEPMPTPEPTEAPTLEPTAEPAFTPAPSLTPTAASEVDAPTTEPTPAPTVEPTQSPQKDLSAIQPCYFTYTRLDGSEQVVYTFSPENIRRMIQTLNAYRAVLPADGHMFFAQPPFPSVAGALQTGQYKGWGGELENTINAYADEGVYMVSVQKVLEEPLLNGEYLYFTTDHHWTPRAACYTANALLRTMGIDPKPYDSYAFTVHKDFYGSASNNNPRLRSTHKPDILEVPVPVSPVKGYRIFWDRSEKEAPLLYDSHTYTAFLGGTQGPWRRFETGVDSGRSCLVIGDSFSNCFVPFLTPYYETVHVTDVRADYYDHARKQWTISQYIQENGIDDVYFILSTANGVNTVYLIETLRACL